jgi:hypothetical protein
MAFCIGTVAITLCACGNLGIKTVDASAEPKKSVNTTLPTGFPVPIYAGADVIEVVEVPIKKTKGYTVKLSTPDDVGKVTSYYAYTLGKADWSVSEMRMETYGLSSAKCLVAVKADNQITVNIGSENNKTIISITLTPIQAYSPTQNK